MNAVVPEIVRITHLEIDRPPFRQAARNGSQFRSEREGLYIKPLEPSYDKFLRAVKKIGDKWHLRKEHKGDQREITRQLLESDKCRMWALMQDGKEIGFCCALDGGFPGLTDKFNIASLDERGYAEIYKIGLYPEYQKHGYGQVLIPAVIDELLEESKGVYLNTWSTNRVNSVPIYEKLGMNVVKTTIDIDGQADNVRFELVGVCSQSGKILGLASKVLESVARAGAGGPCVCPEAVAGPNVT